MTMLQTLRSHLDGQHIPYEAIHHRREYTAQETAADTHTPGGSFAKTVIISVDQSFGVFVLPAVRQVDLNKVARGLGAAQVRLATEQEIAGLCPECEVGAMPPFGQFFKLPTYVSHHLAQDRMITFNAGTHEEAFRMLYRDYAVAVQPTVMDFTVD